MRGELEVSAPYYLLFLWMSIQPVPNELSEAFKFCLKEAAGVDHSVAVAELYENVQKRLNQGEPCCDVRAVFVAASITCWLPNDSALSCCYVR